MKQEGCVLLDWVLGLSWKKQTVLMEMLRAPDYPISPEVKQIITFIRASILHDADSSTAFMLDAKLPSFSKIEKVFERLPQHCTHHILMTLQVIAYDHPSSAISYPALEFYRNAVYASHLNIETGEEYNERMKNRAYDTYKPGERGENKPSLEKIMERRKRLRCPDCGGEGETRPAPAPIGASFHCSKCGYSCSAQAAEKGAVSESAEKNDSLEKQ